MPPPVDAVFQAATDRLRMDLDRKSTVNHDQRGVFKSRVGFPNAAITLNLTNSFHTWRIHSLQAQFDAKTHQLKNQLQLALDTILFLQEDAIALQNELRSARSGPT